MLKERAILAAASEPSNTGGGGESEFIWGADDSHDVKKFDRFGNELWSYTTFTSTIRRTYVDTAGNVYVSENAGNTAKLDPNGNELWNLFVRSYGVALDSNGDVISASTNDGLVRKLSTTNGSTLWTYDPVDEATYILAIAVDSSDNIYFANRSFLFKINTSGNQVFKLAVSLGPNSVRGIAVNSSGEIFTADDIGTLSYFNSSGSFVRSVSVGGFPYGLVIDRDQNVFVSGNTSTNTLRKYNSDLTSLLESYDASNATTYFYTLAADDDGFIYAASRAGQTGIFKFDTNLNLQLTVDTTANYVSAAVLPGRLNVSQGL